jgi:two-component system chemotaxis response regulator CheY
MPDIDGLALTRQLRAQEETARCPILILTTDNTPERKQQAREAGASGWVLKPFQPETLIRAIDSVCQRAGAV